MKTAVIYARYSSDRQTEQSIEGQLRVCHEFAERNDILIVDTYIDRAMTGTNDNRTNFQLMLKDSAKKAWDYVLVYKLDRFSRNKYETTIHKHTLKVNGVKLVSAMENIPDTPEGVILESLLEGMNQYYSMELSQKIKRGMNESRRKGNFTGGNLLFGYKIEKTETGKKIIINEDEAKIVQELFERFASGELVSNLIIELNERGILNKGKTFKRTAVYNLLANEKYVGVYRIRNEVYTNIYPQIVSSSIFEIVKSKIIANRTGKHVPDVIYLLKGKIKCGYCGRSIASESGTSKSGEVKRYYKCIGRKHYKACNKTAIRKDILEKTVIETTYKVLNTPNMLNTLVEKISAASKKRIEDQSILKLLVKEKSEIDRAINNLITAIEKGILTNATKNRLEELEQRQHEINDKISYERARAQLQLSSEEIIKYIRTGLKKKPQVMIDLLIKQIILYDDKIEIYYNYIDKNRPDDFEHQAFSFYTETVIFYVDSHRIGKCPEQKTLELNLLI